MNNNNSLQQQPKQIKEEEEKGRCEILFWKIFRNIVLFNNIFSNFKNKRIFGYNDINCGVEFFFYKFNNSREIIKDKFKSNNYYSIIQNDQDLKFIISKFSKDSIENRLFFNKLFTTFSTKTALNNSTTTIQVDNDIKKWLKIIITCSNFIALDEFIKLFKIDSNLVLEYVQNFSNNDFSFKKFKILNKISLFEINSFSFEKIIKSFNIKFKKLIKIQQIFKNEFYNNYNNNSNNKINELIIELDQFNNKEYLKLEIYSILVSSDSKSVLKEIIYKYYKLIYKLYKLIINSDFKKPIEYYVYFEKDLKKVKNKIELLSSGQKKQLVDFIYPLLQVNFNNKQERIQLLSNMFSGFEKEEEDDENLFFNDYQSNKTIYIINDIIISSNDVDVINHFFNKISTHNIPQILVFDKSLIIGTLISRSIKLIKSKELLNYYFKYYQKHKLFDPENSNVWMSLPFSILEHYENLIKSIDKKIVLQLNDIQNKFHDYINFLNRAITIGPSLYIIKTNEKLETCVICKILETCFFLDNDINRKSNAIISILSNVKLNKILNLDSMFRVMNYNKYSTPPEIIKFLFKSISKELIEINLNNISSNDSNKIDEPIIEFIIAIDGNNEVTKASFGEFIIEKQPKSIEFKISFYLLLQCLYYIDRVDDIIYLFKSVPNIFTKFNAIPKISNSTLDYNINIYNFYNICSFYYLELFINYFINNLNKSSYEINHLYCCLCNASTKRFIQIFKNLISSNQYNNLFKSSLSSPPPPDQHQPLLYQFVLDSIKNSKFLKK